MVEETFPPVGSERWWEGFRFDLGHDHWAEWREHDGVRDLWWVHPCKVRPASEGNEQSAGGFVMSLGWIDISSGERHKLVSADPLEIGGSLLCRTRWGGRPEECGDHGHIRGGVWVPC
jgi:hypothetical protein